MAHITKKPEEQKMSLLKCVCCQPVLQSKIRAITDITQ